MKKVLILLIIFSSFCSFSQSETQPVLTEQQINNFQLQKKIDQLESKIDTFQNKLNINNRLLEKSETALEISSRYSESADKLVDKFLIILTALLTLSGLLGFVGLRRYIRIELSRILHQKERIIIDLFNKHEKERGLLDNSKILILNKKGTTIDKNFLMVLEKFKKPVTENITDIKTYHSKYNFKDFDAIIFDNTDKNGEADNWDFDKNQDDIKEALVKIAKTACLNNVAFIFFGKKDGHFVTQITENSHLINFSNHAATIFANLINLLDFRRLLNEKTI